jgi:hypothetical protein
MAYINFVDMTSNLLRLTMFIIATLQRKILISYLVAFMFHLHARFRMVSSNGLLMIAIKLKSEEKFHASAILLRSLLT